MWMRCLLLLLLLILTGCATSSDCGLGCEYLGRTYLSDPLGEEAPPDSDPLMREDAFDCTTFIETALANGNLDKLNKIRYRDGVVDFLNRNHFMETDWLQNNSDFVADVTAEYGNVAVRTVTIDKQNWLRVVHGIKADFPKQTVSLNYIPYSELRPLNPDTVLIVMFVADNREIRDKIGTDLAVRHVGFLLPGGILRHASSKYGRVMDVDFYMYAMQRATDNKNLGIMLVKIK